MQQKSRFIGVMCLPKILSEQIRELAHLGYANDANSCRSRCGSLTNDGNSHFPSLPQLLTAAAHRLAAVCLARSCSVSKSLNFQNQVNTVLEFNDKIWFVAVRRRRYTHREYRTLDGRSEHSTTAISDCSNPKQAARSQVWVSRAT